MKSKLIMLIVVLLVSVIALSSCVPYPEVSEEVIIVDTADDGFTGGIIYTDNAESAPYITEGYGINTHAIFDNVFPGYRAKVPVTVANGHDKTRTLSLHLRVSEKLADGYECLPNRYFSWITILEPVITLQAGEFYQVPVTIDVPSDTDIKGKRYEVRIVVEDADTTQTTAIGNRIAVETKWFINGY